MAGVVAPLVNGFVLAPSGTAEFYNQGTGTLASVYSDPENVTLVTSHVLDASGSITRYVKARVDVVVKNVGGATVKSFTWGTDAREDRVENAGFTGTLAGGGTGAGGRTTVDAVLSSLYSSLGALDGKVLVNGAGVNLQTALSGLSGVVLNVTSYGAVGNDSTDNKAAITAAMAAAIIAGGGEIFFPPGTYRIAGQVIVPSGCKVTFRGASPGSVILKQATTATSGMFLINDASTSFRNITFSRVSAAMTGALVRTTVAVAFVGCVFAGFGGAHLYDAELTGAAEFTCVDCAFTVNEAAGTVWTSDGIGSVIKLVGCKFTVTANGANILLNNGGGGGDAFAAVSACRMSISGTGVLIANGTVWLAMGACYISGTGGATNYLFGTGYVALAGNVINVGAGTLVFSGLQYLSESGNVLNAASILYANFSTSAAQDAIGPLLTTLVGASATFSPAAQQPVNFVTYPGTNVGTLTIDAPSGTVTPGRRIQFVIYQSGASGPSAIAWNAIYKTYNTGFAHPAMTATIAQNAVLTFAFVWDAAAWVQVT